MEISTEDVHEQHGLSHDEQAHAQAKTLLYDACV